MYRVEASKMRRTPKRDPPEWLPAAVQEAEHERIEAALEDYPTECQVCGDELSSPHPDDPPVCSRACMDALFGQTESH